MNNVHNAFVAAQKRRLSDNERKPVSGPPPLLDRPGAKQRKTETQSTNQQLSPPSQLPCQPQSPSQQQQQQQQQQLPSRSQSSSHQCNLLSLCNELLFEIFKYLDSSSIMALMHCSPRFENLLMDHRFWHNIDLSNAPLPLGILEDILGRATERTHTIKICGPPSSQHVAGEFKQFTCTLTSIFPKVATELQILELQGVSLDFEYIHISEFPASLRRLILKDCSVKVGDQKSIFHTIDKQLVNLEDLSIEDNSWFEPYYIMALSKLPSLRRLSLKGCQMMCKFVPYGSMAARFGFLKLEVLDLRLTPISNSDLQCFSAIESLRELLLESPPNVPQEPTSPTKTSNNSGSSSEDVIPQQPHTMKMLSDDEPSTSRAAMEHLRACKLARSQLTDGKESETESTKPTNKTFDPCNESESKDVGDNNENNTSGGAKSIHCASSESDDDITSSSTSSSDKSDSTDGNRPVPSPLVVIAMPSLGRERYQSAAERAANAANPDQDAAARGAAVPRAYVYVPNGTPPGAPRPSVASILEQMVDQIHTLRGNNPAHSRFLPRRDHVIYMNPQAIAEPLLVMQSRRHRVQPRANFEQVVQHPMFWNMLDPLDRDFTRRRIRQQSSPPQQCFVSDRAMYSFGRAANPVQPDMVWIRNSNRSPNNRLERILLRDYPHITNFTLEHLVQCSPNLVYIDVSGTAVTILGLRNFKNLKPECEVIATHLTTTNEQETDEVAKTAPEKENEAMAEGEGEEAETETKREIEATVDTETESETETETERNTEAETESKSEAETETECKSETEVEAPSEEERGTETVTVTVSETEKAPSENLNDDNDDEWDEPSQHNKNEP